MQFDVFDAVIMMMNMVKCSELRDYWREGSFTYNTGIAELFTYDRFCALLRNLHFANNTMREDGGDQPTAAEKEANPKLRNWKVARGNWKGFQKRKAPVVPQDVENAEPQVRNVRRRA